MTYAVPGRFPLVYAIGDRVLTYDGTLGTVTKRYKPHKLASMCINIHTASGKDIECKEHHIRKVWRKETVIKLD